MDIKQALDYGVKELKVNKIDEPILKIRLLLSYILEMKKEYLIINSTQELKDEEIEQLKKGVKRLLNNEPIQYIIGSQEFMGLKFLVNGNTLIPRCDTEILVEEAINIIKKEKYTQILDLCTGSGAIGISIAKKIENCKVLLTDISYDALKIAEKNCKLNKVTEKIKVLQSDLFKNLEKSNKFHIIVSNPPYIKTKVINTLDKQVQKEPLIALDGGEDGLNVYRKIITNAYKYLNDNGYLCLEIGYDQKEEVISLIKKTNKYDNIYSRKDLSGNDRVVICQKSIE